MGVRAYDNVLITGLSNSGTTDNAGSWNTSVDLDTFVTIPSGATGVIIRLTNGTSNARWVGVRTPGKTTAAALADLSANERSLDVICQLGVGNTVDLYCEDASTAQFRIIGVTDSTWNFLDIDSPTNITSTGNVWASRTLAVTSGSVAACVQSVGLWRPYGETTSLSNNVGVGGPAIVKLDGSLRAEFNTGSTCRIIAEISGGVTFPTWLSASDASLTYDGAWHTSGLTNSGKVLAHIQLDKSGTATAFGFRKTGSSDTVTAGITTNEFFHAPLDSSGQFDYWAETGGTGITLYVHAWFDDFSTSGLSITSVTPSSFDDGRTGIVIAGSGFGASQGSSTLTIGGQAQTVTAWSDTSITFTSVRGSNSMGARSLTITKG